jgi:ribonuclease P protein component
MLPRQNRLKEKKAFLKTLRRGKSVRDDMLLLRFDLEEGYSQTSPKIGFSVGLKFSKKAVERNKAKRLMREAVRSFLGKILPGAEIILCINPKLSARELNLKKLRESVNSLLIKANLLGE